MVTPNSLLERFGLSDTGPYSFLGAKAYFFSKETNGIGVLFISKGVTRVIANRITHGLKANECVLTGRILPEKDMPLVAINEKVWNSEELFYLFVRDHIYQLGGVLLELSGVDGKMSVLPTVDDLVKMMTMIVS